MIPRTMGSSLCFLSKWWPLHSHQTCKVKIPVAVIMTSANIYGGTAKWFANVVSCSPGSSPALIPTLWMRGGWGRTSPRLPQLGRAEPRWTAHLCAQDGTPAPSSGRSHEKGDWRSHQSAPNLVSEKTGVQTERLPTQGAERGLGTGPWQPPLLQQCAE